jgi:hypothetical protein
MLQRLGVPDLPEGDVLTWEETMRQQAFAHPGRQALATPPHGATA